MYSIHSMYVSYSIELNESGDRIDFIANTFRAIVYERFSRGLAALCVNDEIEKDSSTDA